MKREDEKNEEGFKGAFITPEEEIEKYEETIGYVSDKICQLEKKKEEIEKNIINKETEEKDEKRKRRKKRKAEEAEPVQTKTEELEKKRRRIEREIEKMKFLEKELTKLMEDIKLLNPQCDINQ